MSTKLNPPRLHFYDTSLVSAAESAKFRQPDFSDCHWCTLLLLDYKRAAYTKEAYAKDKRAKRVNSWALCYSSALELVIRMYVNQGPAAAKKLAARLEKEDKKLGFPGWVKLAINADWTAQVSGLPPRFRFDVHGFICGEDTRPLDGD